MRELHNRLPEDASSSQTSGIKSSQPSEIEQQQSNSSSSCKSTERDVIAAGGNEHKDFSAAAIKTAAEGVAQITQDTSTDSWTSEDITEFETNERRRQAQMNTPQDPEEISKIYRETAV
jgi:hypothetical protein